MSACNNASLALILGLIVLAILSGSINAQNSQSDYLNAHNTARLQVGVANITWDTTLANYAQSYSNSKISTCSLVHSNGPYGENLAKGSGSFTGLAAVNLWVAEKAYYTYSSNTCQSGKVCGHYTQVVWANSIKLGCGRAQCADGWWFVTCSYDPPGNYIGQWPYYDVSESYRAASTLGINKVSNHS